MRLKEGESADRVAMAGRRMGTMIGKGSVIAYPMEKALEKHGGGLDKIQYQQLGSADVLTALQNGGVDSAWLLDPVWRKVDGEPGYAFLGGQPLGEPLGGMLYGPSLLNDDVDAGVALLRAYIRTMNTYFASDYKQDAAFVTYLANLLKADEDHPQVHPVPPHGLGNPRRHDGPPPVGVQRPGRRGGHAPAGVEDGEPHPVRGGGGPPPLTPNTEGPEPLSDSGPRPSVAGTGFEPATSGL